MVGAAAAISTSARPAMSKPAGDVETGRTATTEQ
jgi:hypothetical protein